MTEFAAFVVSNQCITKETAGVREREDEQNGRRVDEKWPAATNFHLWIRLILCFLVFAHALLFVLFCFLSIFVVIILSVYHRHWWAYAFSACHCSYCNRWWLLLSFTWQINSLYGLDLRTRSRYTVKVNQPTKYLGQRSCSSEVIVRTHTHTGHGLLYNSNC